MRLALFHMAVAAFFFSLMALAVKGVPRLPVVEVVFVRAFLSLALSVLLLKRRGVRLWGTNKPLLVLRGVFGTVGLLAYFSTLHELPLATATVIQYLSPIFTALVASRAVGEKVGARRWLCFAISFAGVAMLKGFDHSVRWPILALGVMGSFGSAMAYNCIARLRHGEDSQVIMLYFPLITTPLMAPWAWSVWVEPMPQEWLMLLLVGLFVQTAQYFMTLSYQHGRPAAVGIVGYLGVLFALLWDIAILHAHLSSGALLGIALVVAGVVVSALLDLREPATETEGPQQHGCCEKAGLRPR